MKVYDVRFTVAIPDEPVELISSLGSEKVEVNVTTIREALCLMHSMINCGEPFTPTAEAMFKNALTELDKVSPLGEHK
jgi:hypothetical protein